MTIVQLAISVQDQADHEVMLIGEHNEFHFIPSNPWVALGERTREQVILDLTPYVKKYKIPFNGTGVKEIVADQQQLITHDGQSYSYDYLDLCRGMRGTPPVGTNACPCRRPQNWFYD